MKHSIALATIIITGIGLVIGLTFINGSYQKHPSELSWQTNAPSSTKDRNNADSSALPKNIDPINTDISSSAGITPEVPNKPEKLFKSWREAIITKNPRSIEQLGMSIAGMGAEAIPFLNELAIDDANERVRAFAVRALGRMRRTDLIPLFINLLRNDSGEAVRTNALWSLSNLGGDDTLTAIKKASLEDKSENIRKQAIETLKVMETNKTK
ncbi:MAG: HEAT repeat domain-containing protein [Planctomycetota bacterium]